MSILHFFMILSSLHTLTPFVRAEEATSSLNVGKNRAVREASMEDGLQLSERAIKSAGIQTQRVSGGLLSVPRSAVVEFQDFTAVYRFRDGRFKAIEFDVVSKTSDRVSFTSGEFRSGDEIVTQGAAFLRATDMDIWGPQADTCVE